MASYIGALDQGTTSTRFMVFDRAGNVVTSAQKEHKQIYPQPGWVEHNAEEIWQRTQEVIADAVRQGGIKPGDLAAIGITNQRETTVLWHKSTGQPAANAIVWQDTRVAGDVAKLSRDLGQDVFRPKTGLPLTTYFSGLKIRWLLENVAGLRRQAEAGEILFGNIDTFLLWKLTGGPRGGVHVTDVSNASRTQLMDLKTLAWDPEILKTFGIPAQVLPRIASSSELYGTVAPDADADAGVGAIAGAIQGTPISGILGDQQAALVGQACFAAGEAKNTYGTGCFMLMNTGERIAQSHHGLLTTVAYKLGSQPAQYALEGSVAISGALVQWMRDNLGLIKSSAEIEELARTVEDNGDVYFVPAFSGLYAPYWKDTARGVITGLTRYANKGHLARAVLEATAYQTRDVAGAMEQDSGIKLNMLRVDGGMIDNDLLMQFQADILDRPVVRPEAKEMTALGAAYAAGLATGFFKGTDELRSQWRAGKTWSPKLAAADRERLYQSWKKSVTRSFDWLA